MEGLDNISSAVLTRVSEEARKIVKDAEEKAKQEIETAKKNREIRFADERRRIISEAEAEAARIAAQASIAERQEILSAKSRVIADIIAKVKKTMSSTSDETSLASLIKESINGLGVNEVRVYVSEKDIAVVKNILKKDKKLEAKVKAVEAVDCGGGAIVESIDGSLRIDNTYDTRLEMILPRVMPEINKELFAGS